MDLDAIKAAAEAGNPQAQTALGCLYDTGQGVPQDLAVAAAWYRKSAENGYVVGQFNLAEMLRDGAGVAQSDEEAFAWYSQAAMQGYAKAMYNLAMMYVQGEGVPRDHTMAYVWLTLAQGGDAEGVEEALAIVAKGIGDKVAEGDNIVAELRPQIQQQTA